MERSTFAVICLAVAGALAVAQPRMPTPIILFNVTKSEPIGFYRLSAEWATRDKLIAYRVPTIGQSYAFTHLPYLKRDPILKSVAAVQGDTVCTLNKLLVINGRVLAGIQDTDSKGDVLPHWLGCRQLKSGEYFAYSGRIANSFDSRYYGPVFVNEILGVYEPVLTNG